MKIRTAITILSAACLVVTAQNIAVKFYGPGNPQLLPDQWPKETLDIGASSALPPGFSSVMTSEELQAHISSLKPSYDLAITAWESSESDKQYVEGAKSAFAMPSREALMWRAIAFTLLDEINIIRDRVNELSTNPSAAFGAFPQRTKNQFKNAIENKIDTKP